MMTKGFLKETNIRGSSYFEINQAWQYILYEYCFTNVIILLLSISDTVFPVSYKNNDRGVLHWFCFLLFLFQSFFVFNIFKSQERGSRSAGKNGWHMFFKIGVFFNFAIFTVKGMCWSPFLFKLQAWGTATLLKRHTITGVFLWILRNF